MDQLPWRLDQLIIQREKDIEEFDVDEQELKGYAEYIGIQLPDEAYLLEFAREGLTAKLPSEWKAYLAPDQSTIYYNTKTKKMQEDHPLDQVYRQVVIKARNDLNEHGNSYENSNYQTSNQHTNLSEIAEDQNEMVNQSEVYQRKRVNHVPDNLRLHIGPLEIKQIHEAHHNFESQKSLEVDKQKQNISKIKEDLIAQIQELKRQQQLKMELLINLEKRNEKLTNALKNKIKDKKKKNHRSNKYQAK